MDATLPKHESGAGADAETAMASIPIPRHGRVLIARRGEKLHWHVCRLPPDPTPLQ